MDRDKIFIGAVAFIVGGLVGAYLLPQFSNSEWGGMRRGMGDNTNTRTQYQGSMDQHFIEEMIPHHQGAIDMAKLAETKAVRNEIKQLAREIITAQTKEIDDMKKWYKDWYGVEVPNDLDGTMGGMMHGGMGMHLDAMTGDLDKLSDAQDFDTEFIRQMIPHHEMAVVMARMLASATQRAEMQTLSKNIIDS